MSVLKVVNKIVRKNGIAVRTINTWKTNTWPLKKDGATKIKEALQCNASTVYKI